MAAREAALSLARFRNAQGIIDPEKQATLQLQMVSKLQDELIGARTQLQQLRAMAPETLNSHPRGADQQPIARDRRAIRAGCRKPPILSATAAQYQRLELEREFADRRLAAAMNSLEEARNEARRKQAYVERIVQPSFRMKLKSPGDFAVSSRPSS